MGNIEKSIPRVPTAPAQPAPSPIQSPFSPSQIQAAQQQPPPQGSTVPQADQYSPQASTVQSTLAQTPQPNQPQNPFRPPWGPPPGQPSPQQSPYEVRNPKDFDSLLKGVFRGT